MAPLPDLDDLAELFGADPVMPDGERWPYATATYRTTRGGYTAEVTIVPSYRAVTVRLTDTAGATLAHLEIDDVNTVGAERAKGRELLRADFPDDGPATLWLRLAPDIALSW